MLKKSLLFFVFLMAVTPSLFSQVSVGIRAGMAGGLFDIKDPDFSGYRMTPRPNLYAGLEADIPFSTVFSFRTGLTFVQKASQIDRFHEISTDYTLGTLYRLTYMELPLSIFARLETGYGNIYIGVGPTLSLGLGGRVQVGRKYVATGRTEEDVLRIDWGKPSASSMINFNSLRRFDAGIGATLAYQLPNGFTITFNYNYGLRNIAHSDATHNSSLNTSYIGLSIGFQMVQ